MKYVKVLSWLAGMALLVSACSAPFAPGPGDLSTVAGRAGDRPAASITGWLWHDACATPMDGEPPLTAAPAGCVNGPSAIGPFHANGLQEANENRIQGVTVRLGNGACPSTGRAEAVTVDPDPSFSFAGLEAGTYCVSIDPFEPANQAALLPGVWTSPAVQEGETGQTVILSEGETRVDVNFGWDYQFLPRTEPAASQQPGLEEIRVENLNVNVGVGSPIPVTVSLTGNWPGLCSQLAEIKQQEGDMRFDITLLATASGPGCRPDNLGLTFGLEIPLNMVEKPQGVYTVTVNSVQTTFDWGALAVSELEDNRYNFQGVALTVDPAVASDFSGELVPERPASSDMPYWEIKPEYVHLTPEGYPISGTPLQPAITVYPVEDYRRLSEQAGKTIDFLSDVLARRPADESKMPFLPVINAVQVFHSNVRYLDFQNGSGVRYLSVLAQYPAPVNNMDLFYTYQGLTADGRHYVSIILPVSHPSLPARPDALTQSEMEQIARDAGYYPATAAMLSTLPDSSFTPDLEKLDAMVESLQIVR
jgi:hypothetical protein